MEKERDKKEKRIRRGKRRKRRRWWWLGPRLHFLFYKPNNHRENRDPHFGTFRNPIKNTKLVAIIYMKRTWRRHLQVLYMFPQSL